MYRLFFKFICLTTIHYTVQDVQVAGSTLRHRRKTHNIEDIIDTLLKSDKLDKLAEKIAEKAANKIDFIQNARLHQNKDIASGVANRASGLDEIKPTEDTNEAKAEMIKLENVKTSLDPLQTKTTINRVTLHSNKEFEQKRHSGKPGYIDMRAAMKKYSSFPLEEISLNFKHFLNKTNEKMNLGKDKERNINKGRNYAPKIIISDLGSKNIKLNNETEDLVNVAQEQNIKSNLVENAKDKNEVANSNDNEGEEENFELLDNTENIESAEKQVVKSSINQNNQYKMEDHKPKIEKIEESESAESEKSIENEKELNNETKETKTLVQNITEPIEGAENFESKEKTTKIIGSQEKTKNHEKDNPNNSQDRFKLEKYDVHIHARDNENKDSPNKNDHSNEKDGSIETKHEENIYKSEETGSEENKVEISDDSENKIYTEASIEKQETDVKPDNKASNQFNKMKVRQEGNKLYTYVQSPDYDEYHDQLSKVNNTDLWSPGDI